MTLSKEYISDKLILLMLALTMVGSILMIVDCVNNNYTRLVLDSNMFTLGTYFTGFGFLMILFLVIYKLLCKQSIKWFHVFLGLIFGLIIPYIMYASIS